MAQPKLVKTTPGPVSKPKANPTPNPILAPEIAPPQHQLVVQLSL